MVTTINQHLPTKHLPTRHRGTSFYPEPFFVDDFAGVKRSHGVDLQNRSEGVEGQSGGGTQEVACRVCTDTETRTDKATKAF